MIRKLLIIFPILLLFTGCTLNNEKYSQVEGIVKYDILYQRIELTSIPENLLPKTMTFTFNKRYSKNTIEGFMGIISIINITDLKKDTVTTVLKFLDNKYYFTSKPREIPCCFEIMDKPEIKFTNDSLLIAGVICEKAFLNFPDSMLNHSIYFTRDIKIKNLNRNTAYEDIEGILMEFMMELSTLTMQFKAKSIKFKPVSDDEFIVPKGHKRISRGKMVEIINQLLE